MKFKEKLILFIKEVRLKKWNAVIDTMNRGKEAEAAKKDQEAALGDLM